MGETEALAGAGRLGWQVDGQGLLGGLAAAKPARFLAVRKALMPQE